MRVKQDLKNQGLTLSATFNIIMSGNYIPLYGAFSQKKQQKRFNKEKEKIQEIANKIRNKQLS